LEGVERDGEFVVQSVGCAVWWGRRSVVFWWEKRVGLVG